MRTDPAFDNTNYLERYRIAFERLRLEGDMDAVGLLFSEHSAASVEYPDRTMTFNAFAAAVHARVTEVLGLLGRPGGPSGLLTSIAVAVRRDVSVVSPQGAYVATRCPYRCRCEVLGQPTAPPFAGHRTPGGTGTTLRGRGTEPVGFIAHPCRPSTEKGPGRARHRQPCPRRAAAVFRRLCSRRDRPTRTAHILVRQEALVLVGPGEFERPSGAPIRADVSLRARDDPVLLNVSPTTRLPPRARLPRRADATACRTQRPFASTPSLPAPASAWAEDMLAWPPPHNPRKGASSCFTNCSLERHPSLFSRLACWRHRRGCYGSVRTPGRCLPQPRQQLQRWLPALLGRQGHPGRWCSLLWQRPRWPGPKTSWLW